MAQTESMIERVARALYQSDVTANYEDGARPDFRASWDVEYPGRRARYRGYARAAIEAMREPTYEMRAAYGEAV